MTSTALRDEIARAFSHSRYPGDDRLTVYNSEGREFDQTFQLLRGKTWVECPVSDFMQGDTPMFDLTPEAFHYFMPALLIASLDDATSAGRCYFGFHPQTPARAMASFPMITQTSS